MTAKLLDNHNRIVGLALAVGLHGVVIALLLLLGPGASPATPAREQLVAVTLDVPSPPPPDKKDAGPAAPPGPIPTEAAAPPPPRPLPQPMPAVPSIDTGTTAASGLSEGQGSGTGAGGAGNGTGSGAITPPQRIAGALTNADYRQARAPEGAAGTVVVEFRVGADGAVQDCGVLRSSGYGVFDQATCRLIRQRFRYRPARDGAGRAVDWTIRTDYTWAPR